MPETIPVVFTLLLKIIELKCVSSCAERFRRTFHGTVPFRQVFEFHVDGTVIMYCTPYVVIPYSAMFHSAEKEVFPSSTVYHTVTSWFHLVPSVPFHNAWFHGISFAFHQKWWTDPNSTKWSTVYQVPETTGGCTVRTVVYLRNYTVPATIGETAISEHVTFFLLVFSSIANMRLSSIRFQAVPRVNEPGAGRSGIRKLLELRGSE